MRKNLQIIIVILTILLINVFGEDDKRSIAFVMDDTLSMDDDIEQVKMQTNQLFDSVQNSNKTKFDQFVLVTFNDPTSEVRIITNNANEFKNSLDQIEVHGGEDCPEMAMQGILNALKVCPSKSVVYVFTDAAAKDYDKFEEVKIISQKKSIQVTFLLTGICDGLIGENYLVYHKIAEATSGQVFHLKKSNITKVIEYVKESIKSERPLLTHLHGKCPLNVAFQVDSKTSNVMVSSSSIWQITNGSETDDSNVMALRVVDLEDHDVESFYVVNLPHIKILKLREPKIGHYKAILNCNETLDTYLSVTGTTSISFKHGFSRDKPTSIKETSTLPLPGENSFLSIVLDNPDEDVTLNTVELIDVNDNVIQKAMNLELFDANQHLYSTGNINLPDKMFKIKVNGYTKSKEIITQIGTTYIEPQKIFGEIDNISPKVNIIDYTDIVTESNQPISLKCIVEAYPKPDIIWENEEAVEFRPEVITLDLTGKFKSILKIENTTKNETYYCRAINTIGKDAAFVNIRRKTGNIDNKSPNVTIIGNTDIIVKFNTPVILKCNVEAHPKPEIVWENDEGEQFRPEIISSNETDHFESVLQIEKSKKNSTYFCRAINSIGKDEAFFNIRRTGGNIDNKSPNVTIIGNTDIIVESNTPITLKCNVEAHPKPKIIWENDKGEQFSPEIISLNVANYFESVLQIEKIKENVTYYCKAENSIGKAEAYVEMRKNVDFDKISTKVTITGNSEINMETHDKLVTLKCSVEAHPKPEFFWENDKGEQFHPEIITVNGTDHFESILQIERTYENTTYHCKAENSFGKAETNVTIIGMEGKPVIENEGKDINIAENEEIYLPCIAKGNPVPSIQWVKNQKDDKNESNPMIFNDHPLRFKATTARSGHYTCEARNYLGVDTKTFNVNVYVPITMNRPEITDITVSEREKFKLPCSASGSDPIIVKLMHISMDNKSSYIKFPEKESTYIVYYASLEDSGLYVCSASNDYSSSNFTYTVDVVAPPSITDKRPKTYTAVKGDLALRIPCKAQGNPKPDITWTYNGLPLAETETQKITEDGTLVLLKIDSNLTGNYTCEAKNRINKDFKTVDVEILAYPKLSEVETSSPTNFIEDGVPSDVICNTSLSNVGLVRWFKDGKEIQNGGESNLRLENPSKRDQGLYTCRVSNDITSETYHTEVIVGLKPIFLSPDPTGSITYIEGSDAFLDCSAQGEPDPQINWTRSDVRIPVKLMDYKIIKMKTKHIGVYKCTVFNSFGYITREYRIKSGECRLSISNDFTGFQPLVQTTSENWPKLEIQNGFIIVPVEIPLLLRCPGSSFNYSGFEKKDKTKAVCIKDSTFDIEGKEIKFSEFKCKKEIVAYAQTQNISCLSKRYSEFYTIGYKYGEQFRGVYDICFDTEDNVPVFSRHSFMRHNSKNVPTKELPWTNSVNHPHNFTQLYDPYQQIRILSSLLGKEFESSSCHFAKKQLIISRDVSPGLSQTSTYNYLNVMPHWVLCYKENWEEVENKVRALVLSREYSIFVWTGTSGRMRLPGQMVKEDVYLRDEFNNRQYVPLYLWKVIQDYEHGMIAIIQINLPNLTSDIALDYVKCTDICHEIEWLQNEEWHNVKKGYTFCCNIIEFEKQFNFVGMFKGDTSVFKT